MTLPRPSADVDGTVRRHATAADVYLQNALAFLERREAGKAGELLWGGIAEALHAVAAWRNTPVKNHKGLRQLVGAIAKETRDGDIAVGFSVAERLHGNFYEVELEPEDIAASVAPILLAVRKILGLIPPEFLVVPEHPA